MENKVFNVSTGKKYLTQLDNTIRPLETCCPTSIAMALTYSGVDLPKYSGQLEDELTKFSNSDRRVVNYYKNHPEGWVRREFALKRPANEIHDVMAFAVNTWAGKEVIKFVWNTTLDNLAANILNGKACPLSGSFPLKRRDGALITIGHVVCLVGFETEQQDIAVGNIDVKKIKGWIIDDPYGNYKTQYQSREALAGNDVVMSVSDFKKYIRTENTDKKWAYLIK